MPLRRLRIAALAVLLASVSMAWLGLQFASFRVSTVPITVWANALFSVWAAVVVVWLARLVARSRGSERITWLVFGAAVPGLILYRVVSLALVYPSFVCVVLLATGTTFGVLSLLVFAASFVERSLRRRQDEARLPRARIRNEPS